MPTPIPRRFIALFGLILILLLGLLGLPPVQAQSEGTQPSSDVPEALARLAIITERSLTRGTRVVTRGETVSLCLGFNSLVLAPGDFDNRPFLQVEPGFDMRLRKEEANVLCLDGASYASNYRVTLLPGFRTRSSAVRSAITRDFAVGDREPMIRFNERRFVLPDTSAGVPFERVNVDQLDLGLYRIDPRNFADADLRAMLSNEASSWYRRYSLKQELAEQIWTGDVTFDPAPRNKVMESLIPLDADLVQEPALYLLEASDPDEPNGRSEIQWLLRSNLGMSVFRSKEEVTVSVRRLDTAEPVADAEVELVAVSNRVLGRTRTDAQGLARFSGASLQGSGNARPAVLTAQDPQGDFNLLDISASPIDLSDRDIAGRALRSALDPFLYTERGVYRPGETVHLGLLLRDHRARVVEPFPLTVRLFRPDGDVHEERVVTVETLAASAGGVALDWVLPDAARLGGWTIRAYADPLAEAIAETRFEVQAFVPPRIEARYVGGLQRMDPAQFDLSVQVDYLFGAPAAGLVVQTDVTLTPAYSPFPDFSSYRFIPELEGDRQQLLQLAETTTDETGRARLQGDLSDRVPALWPQQVQLRSEVIDVDGRITVASATPLLASEQTFIGLRTRASSNTRHDRETPVVIDLVAVDSDGMAAPLTEPLRWRLVRLDRYYNWYRAGGRWRYRSYTTESGISAGTVELASIPRADQPHGTVELPPLSRWGRYRFDVMTVDGRVQTSQPFQVGWVQQAGIETTPDHLEIRFDQSSYAQGSTARVRIAAPFDGPGQLVLADQTVERVLPFEVRDGVAEVPILVDERVGAGLHVLATVFRPETATDAPGPARAIGVGWLPVDVSERRLALMMETPARLRPEELLETTVRVANAEPGESVYVTLSAVDDGLLALTGHLPPDPLDHYFAPRQLAIQVHDLYGRLLDGRSGDVGRIGTGSDVDLESDGGLGARVDTDIQPVSLFSGLVELDANNQATIRFALPPFEGRLRLQLVAWSRTRFGQVQSTVTVRDPVTAAITVPRFLKQGDLARIAIAVQNVELPPDRYELEIRTHGVLAERTLRRQFRLQEGGRRLETVLVEGLAVGDGFIDIELRNQSGLTLQRSRRVPVRQRFPNTIREAVGVLRPGESTILLPDLLDGLRPGSEEIQLSISRRPDLRIDRQLDYLIDYPYGCAEQVSSRLFSLLLASDLLSEQSRQDSLWRARFQELDLMIESGISHLAYPLQRSDGSFSLWRGSRYGNLWLDAYVMDVLGEARRAGFDVPAGLWRRGIQHLRNETNVPANARSPQQVAGLAYALHVVAREGDDVAASARYLLNRDLIRRAGFVSMARLGAALALSGDTRQANVAFERADAMRRLELRTDGTSRRTTPFGGGTRDQLTWARLFMEHADDTTSAVALIPQLLEPEPHRWWRSTQVIVEQLRLIKLLGFAEDDGTPPYRALVATRQITREDAPRGPTLNRRDMQTGIWLLADQGEGLWYRLSAEGEPMNPPAVKDDVVAVERRLYHLDGTPLDGSSVPVGTSLVVVLTGRFDDAVRLNRHLLVVDPLPAGFEVDSANLTTSRAIDSLGWMPELSDTLYTEALDDRFVAAMEKGPSDRRYTLAYLVRAVTVGEFIHPGTSVEDMYRPEFRGRGATTGLFVEERR